MPLGTEIGFGQGDIVLGGVPALPPPTQKGAQHTAAPHFLAHVYCGQTAGWVRIPLSMEVGLVPDDSVLDWDPAPLPT